MFAVRKNIRFYNDIKKRKFVTNMLNRVQETSAYKTIAPLIKSVRFQRTIRVIRVVIITTMVYQLGYQSGMSHFAQDPEVVEDEMTKIVLNIEKSEPISDHIFERGSSTHRRIDYVARSVVNSARTYCKSQLNNAVNNLKHVPIDELDKVEAEILMWKSACRRLQGEWTVVVSRNQDVNAFVTGFCPRKIFVFHGLLTKLELTDDELAMILGHELSHVILGHIDEQLPVNAILLGTQLVLMSLVDPLGMSSFLFDMAVNWMRKYISASYSRQHEHDADELGLLLTSLSCYDINSGASLHKKLASFTHRHNTGWLDTHPASIERHENITELAAVHEAERLTSPKFEQYRRDCTRYRQALRAIGLGY